MAGQFEIHYNIIIEQHDKKKLQASNASGYIKKNNIKALNTPRHMTKTEHTVSITL